MDRDFWRGKRVLVTGHTGFKGSWLSIWLKELGASVIGFSLESTSKNNNYNLSKIGNSIVDLRGDIRNIDDVRYIFENYEIDIVFHLAAQALVSEGYSNPQETYETNVMGSMNILQAIKDKKQKIVGIFITTDKVYENKEQMWGYREIDSIGGYDPYSSSKACCELLIKSFRSSFFKSEEYENHKKSIATVRAGNVIGGGDWGKDRLVPDIFRSIENNEELIIRNPGSVRPWQHVLDPLAGYIELSEKMWQSPISYCEGWNFGPEIEELYDVKEIILRIDRMTGNKLNVKLKENKEFHETNVLLLDITKSKLILKWRPIFDLEQSLLLTTEWYMNYKNENVYDICTTHIKKYMKIMEVAKTC